MAVNLDRQFLKKVRVRVIIGLLHEELQCRTCGARWRVGEPLPADYWRCPNGCNANHETLTRQTVALLCKHAAARWRGSMNLTQDSEVVDLDVALDGQAVVARPFDE